MIVRILAAKPVQYSLNNGVSMMEYTPGEAYEVPDWAAASMIKRGWAKQLTADDLKEAVDAAEQAATEVDLTALRKVDEKQRKRKQEED